LQLNLITIKISATLLGRAYWCRTNKLSILN